MKTQRTRHGLDPFLWQPQSSLLANKKRNFKAAIRGAVVSAVAVVVVAAAAEVDTVLSCPPVPCSSV